MKSVTNPAEVLVGFMHRYFIWIIIVSYVVAAIAPTFGLWIQSAKQTIVISQNRLVFSLPLFMLASLLFNAGLGVKTKELTEILHKPSLLLGGLVGNFATPLAFIVALSFAMKLWHNPEEVQQILVGLALLASMPIAGASTAWTQNANGNLALSLGLVLLTTFLSPVITPLILDAIGFVTIDDYSEDLHELASGGVISFLGIWVILPSLLGVLTHWLIGEHRIATVKPYAKLINYFVLVLLNYSNASISLPEAISQPDIDLLAIMLVITLSMCIAAFVSGYFLAFMFRADRNGTVALMFSLGMNNNGTALVLASVALSDHPQVMLPIIFYNLVQHLVASLVDFTIFQRLSRVD
ncbi:MAG: bile acid:sodium symporter family protein [Methylococcales bacterium]